MYAEFHITHIDGELYDKGEHRGRHYAGHFIIIIIPNIGRQIVMLLASSMLPHTHRVNSTASFYVISWVCVRASLTSFRSRTLDKNCHYFLSLCSANA